jgi:tetratricopeptide (TPR) repeat protein
MDKLVSLHNLSILYIIINHKEALNYCDETYALSLDMKDKNIEFLSLRNYIEFYMLNYDSVKIDSYIKKAYKLLNEVNGAESILKHIKARIYMKENRFYLVKNYLDDAQNYLKKILSYSELHKVYITYSELYYKLSDYDKTLSYCDSCYNYFKMNGENIKLLEILIIYSNNYKELQEIDSALEKAFEALKLSKSLQELNLDSKIIIMISQLYCIKKDYKSAFKFLEKIDLTKKSNTNKLLVYVQYANIYKNMDDVKQAYICYNKATVEMQNNSNNSNKNILEKLYCELLLKDNKPGKTLVSLETLLTESKNTNDIALTLSLEESLGFCYKQLNNNVMAKKYFAEVITKLEVFNDKDNRINKLKDEIKSFN